jgi:hypothetical protein
MNIHRIRLPAQYIRTCTICIQQTLFLHRMIIYQALKNHVSSFLSQQFVLEILVKVIEDRKCSKQLNFVLKIIKKR